MNDAFRAALRAHIQETSLYEPQARPGLRQVLATTLVMLLAGGLIVVIGFS